MHLLFRRVQTTFADLVTDGIPLAPLLQKEAIACGLLITGPVRWTYLGFDGNPETRFTLEVAVPVIAIPEDYQGAYAFRTTENFTCASLVHRGSWMEIPQAYVRLMAFAAEKGYAPSGTSVEIYTHTDFVQEAANVTEVQLGIV